MRNFTLSLFACMAVIVFFVGWEEHQFSTENTAYQQQQQQQLKTSQAVAGQCDPNIVYRAGGLPAIQNRNELGALLEQKGFESGAEVGVLMGTHSREILHQWKSCKYFAVIDIWKHQENYIDSANVDDATHQFFFEKARYNLLPWEDKVHFFRMLSVDAALQIDDNSLDFVYIDARHDYCASMADMLAYWPKLRPGGILAGHDYMTNEEVRLVSPTQDFGLCMNGTRNEGAVRGAVEDFAMAHGLTISVTYKDGGVWSTWMVQKPTRAECV